MANAKIIYIEDECDVAGIALIPGVVRPGAGDEDPGDLVLARTADEFRLTLNGLAVVAVGVVAGNCHYVSRNPADLITGGWRCRVGQDGCFAAPYPKAAVTKPVDCHNRSIIQPGTRTKVTRGR